MEKVAAWQTYLEDNRARFLDELKELLSIPSISSLPEHAADVQRTAEWVSNRLGAAGLEHVEIMPTGGHPVVYADWLHAEGAPTIVIYGHFDVQPVDPLELWDSPPFTPTVRDGRIYARGASDMKGNLLVAVLAAEALMAAEGALPINVKFFFEGQEEILSPRLPAFMAAHADLLACDLVVSADGGQWGEQQPSLTLGSRGACSVRIDVRGAASDLHSGTYGGAVVNPLHALVYILDSMRGADGTILVEGFYDQVVPLTPAEREAIAAAPFDEDAYKQAIAVDALAGEPGYSVYERLWARPTLELNGLWGGFQGEGMKTVLPAEAHAKISCRLAPNQEPATVAGLVAAHAERHAPPGVTVTARVIPAAARPYLVPADNWGNRAVEDVLTQVYGRPPYHTRTGGSVPICRLFQDILGVYTVSLGFGLRDEQIHAPNEFWRLSSFARGSVVYGKLLQALGAERLANTGQQ